MTNIEKVRKLSLFPLLIFFLILTVEAKEQDIPVVVDADDVSYDRTTGEVIAKGNVVMRYKNIILKSDEGVYDVNNNIAYIKGKATIITDKETIRGESAVYDFNTRKAEIKDINVLAYPFFGNARTGKKVSNKEYQLENGYISTCDLVPPHYRLSSRKIKIYSNDKIVARNVFVKIGDIPVFYIPYYSQSLKDKSTPFEFSAGKNKEWGMHFLTRLRYRMNEKNKGKFHFDWYEKRGIGLGITHKKDKDWWGEGLFKIYSIKDELYASSKRKELFSLYPEREGTEDKYLKEDRYKVQLYYSNNFTPRLKFKGEYHKFSDENFMKDFFYREYEIQAQPLTYALWNYSLDNSALSLLLQKRTNRFFTEVEYLPKIEYDFFKQQLAESSFYWEANYSLSSLNKKFANSSLDYDTVRLSLHNVLSYQKNFAWLSVNPYIGNYSTFYSKNKFGEENVLRETLETGISLSAKLYKVFNRNFRLLGETIDKFRHILVPTLTYGYLHPPTVGNDNLFQLDSVDNLARKESVVFKLENKIQAKKGKDTMNLLYFAPSVEYKINQEGKGSFFDNIVGEWEFYPKKGLSLVGETTYNVPLRDWTVFNMDLRLSDKKNNKYFLSLGHRYKRNDSTQGTLSLSYQLTPKLRFDNYLRYEYNTNEFKEQQYSLRLDLHCWWMDLGLTVDKQRPQRSDYTFWVVFTLKAFPEKLHFGYYHSYGNIGDRI